MTWNEGMDSIVTGAIGLGIGVVVAGKVIKDISSIKTQDDDGSEPTINNRWRL